MYPNDLVEGKIIINDQLIEKFSNPRFRSEFALGLVIPFFSQHGGRFSCGFISSMIVTGQSIDNMRNGISYEFQGPNIASFALNGGYDAASNGFRGREVKKLKFIVKYKRDSFTCRLEGEALSKENNNASSALEEADLWKFVIEFYVPLEKAGEVLGISMEPIRFFDERLSNL